MATSTANLTTTNANRYLQQLCKHFGHKVPADFTSHEGHVEFPFGTFHVSATDHELNMKVEASSKAIKTLETFISDHLARFAFKEKPVITWKSAS